MFTYIVVLEFPNPITLVRSLALMQFANLGKTSASQNYESSMLEDYIIFQNSRMS